MSFALPNLLLNGSGLVPGRNRRTSVRQEFEECAKLCRGGSVRKVDSVNPGKLVCRFVEFERDERPGAQIVGDDEGRLVNDALPSDRSSAQRVPVVRAHIAAEGDDRSAFGSERPAARSGRSRQRVAKAVMRREIGGPLR